MCAQKHKIAMVFKIMMEAQLLHRDIALLSTVIQNEPIGLVRLSQKTGLPQHKVRYSLRMLQQDGLIAPSPEGAVSTEKLHSILPRIKREVEDCIQLLDKTNNIIDKIPVK